REVHPTSRGGLGRGYDIANHHVAAVRGGDRYARQRPARLPGFTLGRPLPATALLVRRLPYAHLPGLILVRLGRGLRSAGPERDRGFRPGRGAARAALCERRAAELPAALSAQVPGDDRSAERRAGGSTLSVPVVRTQLPGAAAVQHAPRPGARGPAES